MDWWVWLIIIIVVFAGFLLWWFSGSKKQSPQPMPVQAVQAAPAVPVPPAPADDLEIVEGIGPKIAGVLKNAGVTSFAKLAAMEPAKISDLLSNAGLRLADPTSWPEQARLAAEGKMEELKSLQDSLKGGRKG